MARIRPFQSPNGNETTIALAGRSDVLESVMVSVWGENFSQETSEGLSYWNALLAGVIAYSQESTGGFHVPGRTFFGQTQPTKHRPNFGTITTKEDRPRLL
jgi:hypothetical protein